MCGCGWVCGHDLYGEFQPVRVGLVLVCSGLSCVLSLWSPCCLSCSMWSCLVRSGVLLPVFSCLTWCWVLCCLVLDLYGLATSCPVLSRLAQYSGSVWHCLILSCIHGLWSVMLWCLACFLSRHALSCVACSGLIWSGLVSSGLDWTVLSRLGLLCLVQACFVVFDLGPACQVWCVIPVLYCLLCCHVL